MIFAGAAAAQPPSPSPPAEPPPTAPPIKDEALGAELREIDARAGAITDLTASFEQSKKTVLLKKPLVSNGTVKVKGSRVLWTTTSPRPTAMLVDSAQLRIYYPEQHALEVYDLDDALRRVATSPLPRLDTVNEQFEIVRAPQQPGDASRQLTIDLTPRREDLRSRVKHVRVAIDRTTGLTARIDMTDADDEQTTITFSGARTNQSLDDHDLDLKVPDGTRISMPLEGLRGSPPAAAPMESRK